MTTISLFSNDQLLSVALQPKIASGDQNSVLLHVDFDAEWDGYEKSAVFFTSNEETVFEMILTDGECTVPHEVLAESGILYIGVRGVNTDNNAVKTSTLIKYKIADGAPAGDTTSVEPTPDIYQQVLIASKQNTPLFADDVSKCTDISKLYVLPDGDIWAYMPVGVEVVPQFTNKLTTAGWKANTRLNSSGAETPQDGIECTGFIPVKLGDVLYLGNMKCSNDNSDSNYTYWYFAAYDENQNKLGSFQTMFFIPSNGAVVLESGTSGDVGNIVQINTSNLVSSWGSSSDRDLRFENMAFMRISCEEITDDSIITVNEPIVYKEEPTGYDWCNTGHAFVPADYEDRIIKAETDIATLKKAVSGDLAVYGIVDEENNIIMTGTLESGTYSLKYMAEDGTTTEIGTFTME